MSDGKSWSDSSKSVATRFLGAAVLGVTMLTAVSANFMPAAAQTVCMAHAELKKQLSRKRAETPVAIGLASNGEVIEVFSTGDGATWTMVTTTPSGKSCVVAAGEAWVGDIQVDSDQPV